MIPTDAYKISMLKAGRPFEQEVFYLSYRKAPTSTGYMVMPVDIKEVLDWIFQFNSPENAAEFHLPDYAPDGVTRYETQKEYLARNGFTLPDEVWDLINTTKTVEILYSIPKGGVVYPREPICTLRGPQAIVSWIEPYLIGMMNFLLQMANTDTSETITFQPDVRSFEHIWEGKGFSSGEQKEIAEKFLSGFYFWAKCYSGQYEDNVTEAVQKIIDTGVHLDQIFEVGLRAAVCPEHHQVVIHYLREMGIHKTSNTDWTYDMTPVGTMGHEGIMRWGGDEELAFRKHIEALPRVTMLVDTNDTCKIGIPMAIKLMKEYPDRMDGVRPDSGDLEAQFRLYVQLQKEAGLEPHPWVFEDGITDKDIIRYRKLVQELDYPEDKVFYGLGGYFVDKPDPIGIRRSTISMVYKLSHTESYGPCMKFGDEVESGWSGKQSIPGMPIVVVKGEERIICQYDHIPEGWDVYDDVSKFMSFGSYVPSDRPVVDTATASMISQCTEKRNLRIKGGM